MLDTHKGALEHPGGGGEAISNQASMQMPSHFVKKFTLPLIVTFCFCLFGYFMMSPLLPHSASKDEWVRFLEIFVTDFERHKNDFVVVALLMLMQVAHLLLCIPFINITQTIFGFCYGWWVAGLISGAWECCLVSAFVMQIIARNNKKDDGIASSVFVQNLLSKIRASRLLYVFIWFTQISSIPINSTVLMIGVGQVTTREYLTIHYLVSTLNAFKNTLIGQSIRHSTTPAQVTRLGEITMFVVILPNIITLGLWCCFLVYYRHQSRRPRNSSERAGTKMSMYMPSLVAPISSLNPIFNLSLSPSMIQTNANSIQTNLREEELQGLIDNDVTHTEVQLHIDHANRACREVEILPVWAFETPSCKANIHCAAKASELLFSQETVFNEGMGVDVPMDVLCNSRILKVDGADDAEHARVPP